MNAIEELVRKENAAMRLALELMGFDCNAVIALLQFEGDRMWHELPLQMACVEFDIERARKAGLSDKGLSSMGEVFRGLRRK